VKNRSDCDLVAAADELETQVANRVLLASNDRRIELGKEKYAQRSRAPTYRSAFDARPEEVRHWRKVPTDVPGAHAPVE
jgi:hypothetical protein